MHDRCYQHAHPHTGTLLRGPPPVLEMIQRVRQRECPCLARSAVLCLAQRPTPHCLTLSNVPTAFKREHLFCDIFPQHFPATFGPWTA